MSLQNRVTPFGTLISTPARGEWMGNRGVLHDEQRQIVRHHQGNRWIYCRLSFQNRHRKILTPGRYTELFFLDEATALAAGHRPCVDCQKPKFRVFRDTWTTLFAPVGGKKLFADDIDATLQAERLTAEGEKATFTATLGDLPFGTFVSFADSPRAYLVTPEGLRAWSPEGYAAPEPWPGDRLVQVLTPPSMVKMFKAGFKPKVHATGMPPPPLAEEPSDQPAE